MISRARIDDTGLGAGDERVRSYDRQQFPPSDQPREQHEGDMRRVVRALRPELPFNIEGELLPQEQVLGGGFEHGNGTSIAADATVCDGRASTVRIT